MWDKIGVILSQDERLIKEINNNDISYVKAIYNLNQENSMLVVLAAIKIAFQPNIEERTEANIQLVNSLTSILHLNLAKEYEAVMKIILGAKTDVDSLSAKDVVNAIVAAEGYTELIDIICCMHIFRNEDSLKGLLIAAAKSNCLRVVKLLLETPAYRHFGIEDEDVIEACKVAIASKNDEIYTYLTPNHLKQNDSSMITIASSATILVGPTVVHAFGDMISGPVSVEENYKKSAAIPDLICAEADITYVDITYVVGSVGRSFYDSKGHCQSSSLQSRK